MKNAENKADAKTGGHLKARMISGMLVLGPLVITLFILKLVFAALTASSYCRDSSADNEGKMRVSSTSPSLMRGVGNR